VTNTDSKVSPLGAFFRGVAMGAADLVPGISGGTIALITGIYDRLLNAITAADPMAMSLLLRGQLKPLWQRIDGNFVAALLAGVITAVLGLANGIQWLLATHPLFLWSFFFGLVAASSAMLWRQECPEPTITHALIALIGGVAAVGISLAPIQTFDATPMSFFVAGALAICAMILPGISGSFILILLGMYVPVISALVEFDVPRLLLFGAGCVAGLMAFARVLQKLLAQYRTITMALLAGFLGGSLAALWPWQVPIQTFVDRHGVERVVQSLPVTPVSYAQVIGDSQWFTCLVMAGMGLALVGLGHRWLQRIGDGGR